MTNNFQAFIDEKISFLNTCLQSTYRLVLLPINKILQDYMCELIYIVYQGFNACITVTYDLIRRAITCRNCNEELLDRGDYPGFGRFNSKFELCSINRYTLTGPVPSNRLVQLGGRQELRNTLRASQRLVMRVRIRVHFARDNAPVHLVWLGVAELFEWLRFPQIF